MKRLFYLALAIFPIVALVYFLYPRPTKFGSWKRARDLDAAKLARWTSDVRVPTGTPAFDSLVRAKARGAGKLTPEQRSKLVAVMHVWSLAYRDDSFQDFLKLWRPVSIRWPKAAREFREKLFEQRGMSGAGLNDTQFLEKVYTDFANALDSVARGSLQVVVERTTSFKFYSGFLACPSDWYRSAIYLSEGARSPIRCASEPRAILARDKSLLCARVVGAYFTPMDPHGLALVAIYYYWAPVQRAWYPVEMGHAYTARLAPWSGRGKAPSLWF